MKERVSRRTAAIQTKRRVALIAWSVGLITLIALGIASIADKWMAGGPLFWGSILAIYFAGAFVALVVACIVLEYAVQVWLARRLFRSRRWDARTRKRTLLNAQ
jgi:hypothetical protein